MSESKSLDRNVTAAPVPGAEGIGNALSSGIVTTPDELLRAIARQARMPMVRIGEALVSLGMITPEQLTEALSRQQLDRRVPVGELLVNSGAVSRAELQIALRRKMGYPLVDVDAFQYWGRAVHDLGNQRLPVRGNDVERPVHCDREAETVEPVEGEEVLESVVDVDRVGRDFIRHARE